MKILNTVGKPIKSWCDDLDETALLQANNLARLPFIHSHVALMPDAHAGYGMPIGGVIACKDVIIPNAVGVDIGCGMLAVKTSLTEIETDSLKAVLGILRETVPVGFNHRKEKQEIPDIPFEAKISCKQKEKAAYQLGTLGGGNHFIEIQKGSDGHIWYMIHSGSRNLGKQVAEHYNKKAVAQNAEMQSPVPSNWELAYIEAGTELFERYLADMNYCLSFAQANRDRMSLEIQNAMTEVLKDVSFELPVNIHHNYAGLEEHFGEQLWVHRKGATSAKEGEAGIIPGSQGSASYIVQGKGAAESFQSCSHGAGRKLGRKQNQRSLNFAEEQNRLDDMGFLYSLRPVNELDESSGAYEDINTAMAA